MTKKFIFLIKDRVVTQICLSEPYSEEITQQLLKQGFYMARHQVYADNDRKAMAKYHELQQD
ncbi:hypothetical protein [Tolumonas lignilytica]|uniref:hypothetical protein n=1 Tax=Tolumonas lignilytica TaxID=1283284 RepID=UPI000464C2B9|nr:hypothetical protein [Tolumonas lignilytica]